MLDKDELVSSRVDDSESRKVPFSDSLRRREAPAPSVLIVLALILVVGAIVRLTGWSTGGLFFDDAWVALPARVPLSTAVHMWLSTPGYTLLQRQWSLVAPDNLRWVLALPLITGLVAPAVAFVLGRVLRFPNWIALTMAAFVAVEPCAIEYSVAVKPFELDLVAGMVLLAVAEVVRRNRTVRSLVGLSILSIVAVFMDISLLIVVVGVWLALAVIAYLDRREWSATLLWAGITGLVVVPGALAVEQGIPPYDDQFFRSLGTLVAPPYTPSDLYNVFVKSGGGLAHGLFSTPSPFGLGDHISTSATVFVVAVTVLELALLVVLAAPAAKACVRKRPGDPSLRDLASVFVIVVALLAYVAGKVPIGDGRTDLVIVPAITVLLASGLQRFTAFARRRISPGTAVRVSLVAAVVAAVAGTAFAWEQRSWYPTQDLKALHQKILQHGGSDDVQLVTFRNSYTWAYDQLSPFRVHFSAKSGLSLGIGYWVTFPSPKVLKENSPTNPGVPRLAELPSNDRRLWLIGTTLLNASPSTVHFKSALAQFPSSSSAPTALRQNGWHATSTTLTAPGVFAVLYVRP